MSPRHRRWHRILNSLDLDPDHLARPLAAPPRQDFMTCGSPRTGTTLLAALLYQPPAVVTVAEPWDAMRMGPAELFASLREEIEAGSLRRGRLDVEALLEEGLVRERRDGELTQPVEVAPDCLLGVKLPAFWRYLELLPRTKFLVCLRHPVEPHLSGRMSSRCGTSAGSPSRTACSTSWAVSSGPTSPVGGR